MGQLKSLMNAHHFGVCSIGEFLCKTPMQLPMERAMGYFFLMFRQNAVSNDRPGSDE